ncbi:MAG: dienelactone hydrolase family protein [Myxococcota bacterium]
MGRIITFHANGQEFQGYLALAEGTVAAPGVIVIQEWWGLVDHVKDLCERFAAAGFHALAPDLYAGRATTKPDDAGRMMMALDIHQTELALRGAVEALLTVPTSPPTRGAGTPHPKVGCVGFCMGGQLALLAAAENPQIGATVDFYGIHPKVHVDFAKVSGPVLAFFAEHDESVGVGAMMQLAGAFQANKKRLEVHRYLDAHHAFFNDTRPEVFHPQHAADAWARTKAFLEQYLQS